MLSQLVWRINCNVSNISAIAAAGLALSAWLTTRTAHEFQILGEDEQVQDSWNGTEIQQLEVSACKAEVDVLLITGARPWNTNPQTPQDNYTPNVNPPLEPSHVWLSSASTSSSLCYKPAFVLKAAAGERMNKCEGLRWKPPTTHTRFIQNLTMLKWANEHHTKTRMNYITHYIIDKNTLYNTLFYRQEYTI